MQLKLAEYNKEGKFERFLALGDYWSYGGRFIKFENMVVPKSASQTFAELGIDEGTFFRDEKDPLNRFDGLFNGRTYGEGRFVLIQWCGQEWEDSVYISEMPTYAFNEAAILKYGAEEVSFKTRDKTYIWDAAAEIFSLYEFKGNIHQQPELWGKINERTL